MLVRRGTVIWFGQFRCKFGWNTAEVLVDRISYLERLFKVFVVYLQLFNVGRWPLSVYNHLIGVTGCQPFFIQLITNFNWFFKPPVIQGLFDLFLILIIFKGACSLLILLKMWRNLDKLSFASLLLYTGSQFAFLSVFWKEILSNFLKSLTSIVLGMSLHFGSYTRLKTGKWSAISVTKFEWIWFKQLIFVSVRRVASNTKGLKPSDWIRLRCSFGIMLLESVLMLKSPSIKHLRLDK